MNLTIELGETLAAFLNRFIEMSYTGMGLGTLLVFVLGLAWLFARYAK